MEFKKEDIDRINEIEKEILSLKIEEHGVKYTPDVEMVISIKESFLVEKFGPENLSLAMQELGMDRKSLFDQDKYTLLSNFLNENYGFF